MHAPRRGARAESGYRASSTLSAASGGRLFRMRARRLLPLLLVLCAVALVATGCFESKVSDTTISGEITIGQGTSAQTVDPAQGEGTVTGGEESTGERLDGGASPPARTRASSSRDESTGGASGADLAAGKAAFTATCGGCHTLKDAGTTGNVGPDLDSLAPLTAETVDAADQERRRRDAAEAADGRGRRERRRVRGVGRRQVTGSRRVLHLPPGSTRARCAPSRWISTAPCSTRRSSRPRAPPRRSRAPRRPASPA